MKTGIGKTSLCLAGLILSMTLATVVAGQTAVGAGQGGTASVLDRVQREDDPELSELIRVAVANRKSVANISDQEVLDLVRKVTQSYAQIKLLDQQIEQVTQKVKAMAGPAAMQSELVLAKAELESKRMTELANLRELMGVVPRFPFESQPVPSLNAWLSILPIDERVLVLDALKPFSDYWAMERHTVAGLLSEKETLDYVRGRLQDKNSLPLRVDIYHKAETNSVCGRLRDAILALAKEANAEMRTEVRLQQNAWAGSGTSTFFLREGKIRTLYPCALRRPDGGPKFLVSGLVDPNDLEQSILWRLTMPKNLPLRFLIEHDQASTKLAEQVAGTARAAAKRLGVAELVEVAVALVEPVPEITFLGRWEALGKGYIQVLDVQTDGVCQAIVGDGSQAIKAGASVKGTWMPTTRGILVDISDRVPYKTPYFYLGHFDQKGNLVVDRVEIHTQGSLHSVGVGRTVFKKVQ